MSTPYILAVALVALIYGSAFQIYINVAKPKFAKHKGDVALGYLIIMICALLYWITIPILALATCVYIGSKVGTYVLNKILQRKEKKDAS